MRTAILVPLLFVVFACSGVSRLDMGSVGSRAMWQRPDDVVGALDIAPGDQVADIGAGDGYFAPYLSEAVGGDGRVYAVEVDPEVAPELEKSVADESLGNVEVVAGEYHDPRLPDGQIDVILLVNTYHHIEDRPAYFRRLQADLAPDGKVAVLEPNEELSGVLGLFLDDGHTSRAGAVRGELQEAGYDVEASHEILPIQIFEVFRVR